MLAACASVIAVLVVLSATGISQAVDALPLVDSGPASSGIPDPGTSIPANPAYAQVCTATPVDDSPACLAAVVAAIDHARAAEGLKPIGLPTGFAGLPVARQVFVAINLERVDRGLPPFTKMSVRLDAVARAGALRGEDPGPAPGGFAAGDGEWAGSVDNGLDALYLLLYDDGAGGPNVDCPAPGAEGCWAHRDGILADYGRGGVLEMGVVLTGGSGVDTNSLGIEMAVDEA